MYTTFYSDKHLYGQPVCGERPVVVLVHGGRVQVRAQLLVHAKLVELGPEMRKREQKLS
jgi:hypothetical protein